MPAPEQLRAPAVWVTARNWAMGARERVGDARMVTPSGEIALDALDALVDRLQARTSSPRPERSRLSTVARTLVKDARLAGLHLHGSRRGAFEATAEAHPAFVWQHHDPFFTLGRRIARRHDVPLVQFVDAPHVWEARRWGVSRPGWGTLLERLGERPQLRSADLVVCVSGDVATAVEDLAGPSTPVSVVPCTADERFFRVDGDEVASLRGRLGFDSGDVVVGWAGSFRTFHAADDLVVAFDRVAHRHPRLHLVFVGDGPHRRVVEELALRSAACERITFTGSVPYTRMPAHVGMFDVAVVTARDGGAFHYSPLKLREYRAAGRAVVAPRAGQVAETVRDGADGLLYEPGDIDTLAAAIDTLASEAALRRRLADAARTTESEGGGAHAHIDQVLGALRALH